MDGSLSDHQSYDAGALAVDLQDVQVTFHGPGGAVPILRGLSLQVGRGEAVGIIGPSGSGKSTMMMVTAGLEAATAGRVIVAGHALSGLSEDALARFRRDYVGIVFQSFHLIPTMTALENVAIPLELAGRADAFSCAEKELAAVGLGHRLTHRPSQLSGGEQQRVALARAFAANPKVLLADEPTGNLDRSTGEQIMELLFERRAATGCTMLLITHDPVLARRCDRVVRLEDGLLVEDCAAMG